MSGRNPIAFLSMPKFIGAVLGMGGGVVFVKKATVFKLTGIAKKYS